VHILKSAIILGLLFPLLPQKSLAAIGNYSPSRNSFDLIFRAGLSKGGDKTESWTKYYPSMADPAPIIESPNVESGGGLYLGLGIEKYLSKYPVSFELSAEHHSSRLFVFPDTSSPELKKTIFNVIPLINSGKHKIGVGVTYHINSTYATNSPNDSYEYFDSQIGNISPVIDLELENSHGVIFQYVYGEDTLKYGFKVTKIDYKTKSLVTSSQVYNADSTPSYSRAISGDNVSIFIQLSLGGK